MSVKRIISLLFIVLVGAWASSSAQGDDFIDDVYFWDTETTQPSPTIDQRNVNNQPRGNPDVTEVQITFIEDSITQHSDTVVRAIIRR